MNQGVVVKFIGGVSLNVYGSFAVVGADYSPVYFTSIKDDTIGGDTNGDGSGSAPGRGDWNEIYVSAAGSAQINHAVVRYGLYALHSMGGDTGITSSMFITNNYGVFLQNMTANADVRIQGNIFGSNIESINVWNSSLRGPVFEGNKGMPEQGGGQTRIGFYATTFTGTTQLGANAELSYGFFGSKVAQGQSLIIAPGTVVKPLSANSSSDCAQGNYCSLQVDGRLDVSGTYANPVYFTSIKDDTIGGDTNGDGSGSAPGRGDWNEIYVSAAGSAQINHAVVRYGLYALHSMGGDTGITNSTFISNYYGIFLKNMPASANVRIQGNTFGSNSESINVWNSSLRGSVFEGNTGMPEQGGGQTRIGFYATTFTGTTQLGANAELPYGFFGSKVAQGQSLIIAPGTVVKPLSANSSSDCAIGNVCSLQVDGRLDVNGTYTNPVYLTSYRDDTIGGDTNGDGSGSVPGKSDWNEIYVSATGSAQINHAVVRYGRYAVHSMGGDTGITSSIFVSNVVGVFLKNMPASANVRIQGNTFGSNSESINVVDSSLRGSVFEGNTGVPIEGGGWTRIGFYNTTFTGTTQLDANAELPYGFFGTKVAQGQRLIIAPGAVVKPLRSDPSSDCAIGNQCSLIVEGRLDVNGTYTNPVYLTSYRDDTIGGDTNGDGAFSTAGYNDWDQIDVRAGSMVTMTNAVVRHGNYGLHNTGGQLNVSASSFSSNYRGVTVHSGLTVVDSSNFVGNTYGVYNWSLSAYVDAKHNFWGSPNGPIPYGSGDSVNYETRYFPYPDCACYRVTRVFVDVYPWRGHEYRVANTYSTAGSAWQGRLSDPVNTATGNYSVQQNDVNIPTRGLPLAFTRAYNSAFPTSGAMGSGWTHSYASALVENADGSVLVTHGDGHQELYTVSAGTYVPPPGTFSVLVKAADGFTLTQKDQSTLAFSLQGKLQRMADRNGNTTVLNYVGGRLMSVVEPAGRMLTFTYDGSDHIVSVSDGIGRVVQYGYSLAGDLVAVTDTLGSATTYTYDVNHRLLTAVDANLHAFVSNGYDPEGRVITQTDAVGNVSTFLYDILNRVTLVTDPLGRTTRHYYDDQLRLITDTNPMGGSTVYSYDAAFNRTSIRDASGSTTRYIFDALGNATNITDSLRGTVRQVFDSQSNLLSTSDQVGNQTHSAFDAHANRVAYTDALGSVTSFIYFSDTIRNGLLAARMDANGGVTRFDYDGYGNRVTITDALGGVARSEFDLVGRPVSERDANGRISLFAYDAANRLISQTNALGNVTLLGYDRVGNRTVVTDSMGNTRLFTFSAQDKLAAESNELGAVRVYTYDAVGQLIAERDFNGNVRRNGYDAVGRIVSSSNALSETTLFGYDVLGNVISQVNPLGKATLFGYDRLGRQIAITNPLGSVSRSVYDAVGNRIIVTDANGGATRYGYDALNRNVVMTDAMGGTVRFAYDALSNRVLVTDANGHVKAVVYDLLNRPISTSDPLGFVRRIGYDPSGNVISTTDALLVTTVFTYDAANRLVAQAGPDETILYEYDPLNRRTTMTESTGVTTYTRDALGQPISITSSLGTVGYRFDGNGNRTQTLYPDGSAVTTTFDAVNRMRFVMAASGIVTYTYDAGGREFRIDFPNGTFAQKTYDVADRLTAVTNTSAVSGVLAFSRYGLDAVGNRLFVTETEGATRFTYDALFRLVQAQYPTATVKYAYDASGNRTVMTSTTVITYSYDAGDRLQSAAGITFTWDANGNMLSKGPTQYSWDSQDRLRGIVSGTQVVSMTYNGDGARLQKWANGSTVTYTQDLESPLPRVLVENVDGQSRRYVYGAWPLATSASDGVRYYHADGLGSVRAKSNAAGQRSAANMYDAFGAVRKQSGEDGDSVLFAGEQFDSEIGLIFLRARYYDPMVGRFLSRDPMAGTTPTTQGLNPYVYVENRPTILTDPSGKFPFLIPVVAAGIVLYGIYHSGSGLNDATHDFVDNYSGKRMRALAAIENGNLDDAERLLDEADRNLPGSIRNLNSAVFDIALTPGTSLGGLAQLPTSLYGFSVGRLVSLLRKPFARALYLPGMNSAFPEYGHYDTQNAEYSAEPTWFRYGTQYAPTVGAPPSRNECTKSTCPR